tara:strand:+ start:1695 stop:2153 length:459 start_codon:yes stop_codon:yes gene_type:complete
MQDIFLNILRTQAQTVYVISSGNSDSKEAMTVSSVASLSADPPRMLVCINKSAVMHDFLKTTQSFCLNLLSNEQKNVADICSNSEKINERFSNDSWLKKKETPYLENAQSNLFCNLKEIMEDTTHSIFIGEVQDLIHNDALKPLVYREGKYV